MTGSRDWLVVQQPSSPSQRYLFCDRNRILSNTWFLRCFLGGRKLITAGFRVETKRMAEAGASAGSPNLELESCWRRVGDQGQMLDGKGAAARTAREMDGTWCTSRGVQISNKKRRSGATRREIVVVGSGVRGNSKAPIKKSAPPTGRGKPVMVVVRGGVREKSKARAAALRVGGRWRWVEECAGVKISKKNLGAALRAAPAAGCDGDVERTRHATSESGGRGILNQKDGGGAARVGAPRLAREVVGPEKVGYAAQARDERAESGVVV
ncbi:hypothetical protein C8J57DRAFT_1225234 [Mycena rebaudengoi]|nr:hypothetical protein C8J57DRAFT_1225234 [Mycena rebaudengoi]